MRIGLTQVFVLLSFVALQAQEAYFGISSREDDSFADWIVFTDVEDEEGEITRRWRFGDDWSEWDYNIGEYSGTIKMKWKDDPSQWEVRGDGDIVNIRTKWRGDYSEWRLSDGTHTLTLISKYRNVNEEWFVREKTYGKFQMYTLYEGDRRDWEVIDELDENVSFAMRTALVFIVMYHGTPKF